MAGFAPEVLDLLRKLGGGISAPEGLGSFVPFHVRTAADGGSDDNNGRSWEKAFLTIQKGLDAVRDLGGRGRGIVLVGPGGYTEDLVTPLNSVAPFGMLLGVSPTEQSRGAVYVAPATLATPTLHVRARGWLIAGFEFDAVVGAGAILLDHDAANVDARNCEIRNNWINGQAAADYGIDFRGAPPFVVIRRNLIWNVLGDAIRCSASPHMAPSSVVIEYNDFESNTNHINMNPRGFRNSRIRHNKLHKEGDINATIMIDNRAGDHCLIGPDNVLGGTYDNGGGYYAGTDEDWYGNASEDGYTTANPGP